MPEEFQSESSDMDCPDCKSSKIISAKGRYGVYWKCGSDAKPRCRFTLSAKPTGEFCEYPRGQKVGDKCGALIVEGTKTIPNRCSDRECPNRNPHKLAKKT